MALTEDQCEDFKKLAEDFAWHSGQGGKNDWQGFVEGMSDDLYEVMDASFENTEEVEDIFDAAFK